ncbi:hypothetical protein L0F63_005303 [Massospora cicadina]|nr:hypothetical protein L0F63_005303 [Massospora cicadina]
MVPLGSTLESLWALVLEQQPKAAEVDPIFEGLLGTSLAPAQPAETAPHGAPATQLGPQYKSWLWAQLMAFPKINLFLIDSLDSSLKERPDLKGLPYASVEQKYGETLRILVHTSIQEEYVYAKAIDMPQIHKDILMESVLSKKVAKAPKSLHSIIKRLIALDVLARMPVVFEKGYTYMVVHKHFAHKNEMLALCTQEASQNVREGQAKPTDTQGVRVTLTMNLSKRALSDALELARGKFLLYEELAKTLGIPYKKPGARSRFRRLIRSMHNQQYVERLRKVNPLTHKLQHGLKLIKPYRGSTVSMPQPPYAAVGRIEYGVPIEHQIYSAIVAAGDKGIASFELRRQLYGMDRKIFEVYTSTMLREPTDGGRPLVCSVWEFLGKKRYLRLFTAEAYDRLQLTANPPKPAEASSAEARIENVERVKVEAAPAHLVPSITGALRENLLLKIVRDKGMVVFDRELHKQLDQAVNSGFNLDRMTLQRTVDKLVAEDRVCLLHVKAPLLDGTSTTILLLVDPSIGPGHPQVAQFISHLRDEAVYKVRSLRPPPPNPDQVDWEVHSNPTTLPTAKRTIGRLLAIDDSLTRQAAQGAGKASEDSEGSDVTDSAVGTSWPRRYQRQGLVRSGIVRIKVFHLALLKIIANSDDPLFRQRTLPTHQIFSLMPLECYLSLVPLRNPSDDLYDYAAVPENLAIPVGQVPPNIHQILDFKGRFKSRLQFLLQQLAGLGLLVPLNLTCVDDRGVVHVPQPPINHDPVNFHPYYFLPEWFDLGRLLALEGLAKNRIYPLSTAESAAVMWSDLKIIATRHPDRVRSQDVAPNLTQTMRFLSQPRRWNLTYAFTLEQRNILESYIGARGSAPADDTILCQELGRRFKLWPSYIRSYFLQRGRTLVRQRHDLILRRRRARFAQLAEAAILPAPKRQRQRRAPTPKPRPVILAKGKPTKFPRRKPHPRPDLDDVLLHLYAIAKFRARDGVASWVELSRLVPEMGKDYPRRRIASILRYTEGQNRFAELLTKWRAIYSQGIISGELQEKAYCPNSNEPKILVPENPNPADPASCLPSWNTLWRAPTMSCRPPLTRLPRLPTSVAALYARHDVVPAIKCCSLNAGILLYSLSPNESVPQPALAKPLVAGSELAFFFENLIVDYCSMVSFLDLAQSQSFTTRFRNLALDHPWLRGDLPLDVDLEVTKVAIKIILLAPSSTENAIMSANFLDQFSPAAIKEAALALRRGDTITNLRIRGNGSTRDIRHALESSRVGAPNYRLTDKFLATLGGASPFFLFLLARLCHQELVMPTLRPPAPLSPPVSPFIGPGGMMALLSMVSTFEVDLEAAHLPEVDELVPSRTTSRNKLREWAFKHDFNVHVRLLDAPLCRANPAVQDPPAPSSPLAGVVDGSQLPMVTNSQGVKASQDLFHLIDGYGPAGLPFVQMMESISPHQLEDLDRLLSSEPPLVYRVGADVCRLVTKNHHAKWMVCVRPGISEGVVDGVNHEAMMVVAHPWTFFDGTVNERVFAMYANATLSHIVKCPGITLASLHLRLGSIANRNDLHVLTDYLKESGCILSRHFVQPVRAGPFSLREGYREIAPRWSHLPHHPREVTCFWPQPHFYLRGPDLSLVSFPPRVQPNQDPETNLFHYSHEDGIPTLFSEVPAVKQPFDTD